MATAQGARQQDGTLHVGKWGGWAHRALRAEGWGLALVAAGGLHHLAMEALSLCHLLCTTAATHQQPGSC